MSWRGDKRTTAARGYGARWQRERLVQLAEHPLCAWCAGHGVVRAATVVDHKKPHRGDEALFWDRTNWQSLCKTCHDSAKQAEERSGKRQIRIGLDGFPIDEVSESSRTGGEVSDGSLTDAPKPGGG